MIRKGIIVVLTLLVLSTVVVYIDSYITVPNPRVWVVQRVVVVYINPGTLVVAVGPNLYLKEFSVFGFECRLQSRSGIVRYIIPFWMPFILFATYPTIAFIRCPLRRYRRRRIGLCIHCGYNLTGNTTGVCSECGVVIL